MRPALALALVVVLAVPAAPNDYLRNRAKPKEGYRYPDCFCTLRGERVEIGEERCLRVDGRTFTARCDMAQNNTIWREVREGCTPERISRAHGHPDGRATRGCGALPRHVTSVLTRIGAVCLS